MTNAKIMKAVNEEALRNAAGGDSGDSMFELKNNLFLYKSGDLVEVYDNFLHITTTRGKIISCKKDFNQGLLLSPDWIPWYRVKLETGSERWVTANDIESGRF